MNKEQSARREDMISDVVHKFRLRDWGQTEDTDTQHKVIRTDPDKIERASILTEERIGQ